MSSIKKNYWIGIVVIFSVSMFIKPALCFLILGSLILYFSLESILFLRKVTKNGIEWTGKIIKYQIERGGYKTPLIEFTTMTGELIREQPHVYTATDLSKFRTYKNSIDQPVPILYDPDDPKKFVLKNESPLNYVTSVISILAGLFFVGLSISSFLGYIKLS